MAQQTAVEWLIEQLVELDKELDGRRKSDDSTVIKINPTKIYKQAKQMEKEQQIENNKLKAIVEFYEQGCGKEECKVKEPHVH